MKCSEVMTTNVECCRVDDAVARVAATMRDRNIGFVPVVNEAGEVVGTVTDRDLALRVIAEHRASEATRVGDVMTHDVVVCRPADELQTAELLMSQYKVSRIVCIDGDGHPVGVISLSDIAAFELVGHVGAVFRAVTQREAVRAH